MTLSTRLTVAMVALVLLTATAVGYLTYRNVEAFALPPVIFDDTLPTPRDTLLLSLADSAGVLDEMLSPEEVRKASKRIAEVIALEEIGRSVQAVESIRREVLAAAANARLS